MDITDKAIVPRADASSIVVIAASAGGLKAIDELLGALHEDNNTRYFILQHLASDHDCALISKLQSRTHMSVVGMSDGILTLPNTMYVLPPANIARLVEDKLFVSKAPDAAFAHPVDVFCTSIAEQTDCLATAVFLSGVGDDGCAGALALKSAGHQVLVQAPETAQFPNLPKRILNTCTSVDSALSIDSIAARLNQEKQTENTLAQYSVNDQQVLRGMNAELHERIAFLENKVNHLQEMLAAQTDARERAPLTPLNVLLVDGDSSDRALIRASLDAIAEEQYEVTEADNAGDAMRLLTEHQFDLCLLDYRLDDITASSLLDALPDNRLDTAFMVISDLLDLVIEDHALNAKSVMALDKKRLTPEILRKSIQDVMQSEAPHQGEVNV